MAEISKPAGLSKTWAKLGDKYEPTDGKKDIGWVVEIPTCQDFNYLMNRSDTAIAHINQFGIAKHDPDTEYRAFESLVQKSNKLYVCVQTHTNQNPVVDSSEIYWRFLADFTRKSKPLLSLSSLSGGWSVDIATTARVENGFLKITGRISGGALTGGTVIYTLPAGYRPAADKQFYCLCSDGAYTTTGIATLQVSTAGVITILVSPASMQYIEFNCSLEM